MKNFEACIRWCRDAGKTIRDSILKKLKHAPNIVFVSFGKGCRIVVGEESLEIRWFWWETPNKFDSWRGLEDTGNLIAGQKNRKPPVWRRDPLCKTSLRMRIRSIHFIQN
jgi:hypothetical protein